MNRLPFVLLGLLLAGCSTGIAVDKYNAAPASRASFMQCHGYSCTTKTATGFTEADWKKVVAIFRPPARTAEEERSKIAAALALMERQIGVKTGTSEDLPMAGMVKESTLQLDCIDETVNTTHYIEFLQDAGLLRFHEITEPTHRGYIFDARWPHNTAVLREKDNGVLWAVDTFYRANGEEPYILPRSDWLAGWKPPGATQ